MSRLNRPLVALGAFSLVTGVVACSDGGSEGRFAPPLEGAPTGEPRIALVVHDPPGDDLEPGAGEYVVLANDLSIRADLGGWMVEVDGLRVPVGIGTQIDAGAELRVHPGPGEDSAGEVFAGLDTAPLQAGSTVILRDVAGNPIHRVRIP